MQVPSYIVQLCLVIRESYFIPHYNVLRKIAFLEKHSPEVVDALIIQEELQTLYDVLIQVQNSAESQNLKNKMKPKVIKELSKEEEIQRAKNSFIFTNFV